MCMGSKYLVNREDLGKRVIGYTVYNSSTQDFSGMTERQIKDSIKAGVPVYGFVLAEDGSLQLDKADFHCNNYMVRNGINTLSPAFEHDGVANIFYIVVGVSKDSNGQTVYETVSSRYGRSTITEQKLKLLMEIGAIQGGVYLDGKNKLAICKGVTDSRTE